LKYKVLASSVLVICLTLAGFFALPLTEETGTKTLDNCYVGVAFCGNTTVEAQILIDKVKIYTNLFVIQSGPVSWNKTALDEICEYAVASGLKIIVYFGDLNPRVLDRNGLTWRTDWVKTAYERWGESFLGLYYYDEWGGIWVDGNWTQNYIEAMPNPNYDNVATNFVQAISRELSYVPNRDQFQLFVSDYMLYWYDYLGGYDVVFAQVGWNHSLSQDIALVRGAATMQNKDWGIIITWKYKQAPYLDSGVEVYSQMTSAYRSGARYIVLFNYPSLEGNPYGVMQDEHFEALSKFWSEATSGKLSWGSVKAEAVLVLPNNYGWGMRHPEDRIWGFWGPDSKSPDIWLLSRELLTKYGNNLDIIYDNQNFNPTEKYVKTYFWNSNV